LSLAAVQDGFLGSLEVAACTDEPVPAAVGKLFARADGFVGQAATKPAKAARFLRRAATRLRKTGTKLTRVHGRISPACETALGAVVAEAQIRLACLSGVKATAPGSRRVP
jgi:cytosine/adenosine deaminase-related metal-dependent hydrolase